MKVLESLLAISAYPIPLRTIEVAAQRRGLDTDSDTDTATYGDPAYRLATADLMMWLYYAPDVSQGGQSYSLTDAQRAEFMRRARRIYDELGDGEEANKGIRYGYKGDSL